MPNTFIVMAGGAIGAALRYHFGRWWPNDAAAGWPLATLGVNLIGGLAMGLLFGALARGGGEGGEGWRLLIGVGLLGGFTTFSAFSIEVVQMIERGRIAEGAAYALLSVAGSVVACAAGLAVVRSL